MLIRRFLFVVLMLAGLSLALTPPAPALPPCPSGAATCSLVSDIACYSYCQQRGQVYDYCNLQTRCCVCSA